MKQYVSGTTQRRGCTAAMSAGLEDHLMSKDSQVHHGVIVLIIPPLNVIQLTTFVDSASIK